MIGEQERLEKMYGELGEEHLHDLYDDRDTLTVDGQLALARVMEARGLRPKPDAAALQPLATEAGPELEQGFGPAIPGVFPSGAGMMERTLEHGGERRAGMVMLITFFDGHELTRACTALDDANYDFALEELDRDGLSGAASSTAIWVEDGERPQAEAVLREKLGLFPLAELSDAGNPTADDGMMTLGEFSSAEEAERVKGLLTGAAIPCVVSEDDGEYLVEVKGTDHERGLALVSAAMGLQAD